MFDFNLDMTDVKSSGPMTVEAGTYTVISDNAELKDSKSGGQYINMKLKILGPKFENATIFTMFNVKNPNPKAVEIGLSQLKGFMNAAGINEQKLNNPAQLVGYKCQAVVKMKKDSYGVKAVVSYFKPIDSASKDQTFTNSKETDVPFA
jgi:hypothetical protein